MWIRGTKPSFEKNSFAIFSGAVAVGSKGGLTVPGATCAVAVVVWDVAASAWSVRASMWAFASSMSEVTASMHDVQAMCGLLHPL